MMFSMMFLGCSILGSFSSVLVLIGLRKDQREFLVPWIFVMSLDIFIATIHFFFVLIFGNLKFEPLTGTLFTIDFFIMCLNVRNNIKTLRENFFQLQSSRLPFSSCIVSFALCLNTKSTKSVVD